MNLAITHALPVHPMMKVVRDEERIFQTRYLQGLNLITVRGWSVTTDIHIKYTQLLTDIQTHFVSSDSLNLHIKYELFNSSSLRYLFKIIKTLNEAHAKGKAIKIYWSCASSNEAEMIDMGLDLANMSDFKFQISYL
ncbi:MAG: SiaC family regulatory phosphoprotein [Cyclobacteriaceae bacterium]